MRHLYALAAGSVVAFGTIASGDVLQSQTPAGFSSFVATTAFGPWEADDFTFHHADHWIDTVSWWGGRNSDTPVPDGFYIRFYDSFFDTSLGYFRPGDLLIEHFITGDAGQHTDVYSHAEYYAYTADLPTPFLALGDETYWISIQADMTNDPNSQWWGWRMSDAFEGDPAVVVSGTDYLHITDPPYDMVDTPDMAFVLDGRFIPAPGVVALGGLAGLLAARRRRVTPLRDSLSHEPRP